jgi:hypothetical protein
MCVLYWEIPLMKFCAILTVLLVAGCASVGERAYSPAKSREKKAYKKADRGITPLNVQTNFDAFVKMEVAWAGIIKDVQYNETERTFQVAFEVEHRGFDWIDHGGKQPFRLDSGGDGMFRTGWVVDKPTRISYLQMLAAPGDMLIVYGKPYRMKEGVVQLAATALRPIKQDHYAIREGETAASPSMELPAEPSQEDVKSPRNRTLEILESMDPAATP